MKRFFNETDKHEHSWQPDYVASSIFDIDYKLLYKQGIRGVAYDVDGTLTESGAVVIEKQKAVKLIKLLDEAGIKTRLIASNAERDLSKIVTTLDGFVAVQPHDHKPKPFKQFYRQVIAKADLPAEQIVMVGDRLIQDVVGAKRTGLKSVIVAIQPNHVTKQDKFMLRHIWQPKTVARRSKNR